MDGGDLATNITMSDSSYLAVSKVGAMALTGAVPLILGLLPSKMNNLVRSDNIRHQSLVSIFLCYGGGVLFGLSLLHLLPEVRESFEKIDFGDDYAKVMGIMAECLVSVGFFMIYFIEEFVHLACDSKLQHDHCPDDHTRSISVHRSFTTARHNCDAGELVDPEGHTESEALLRPRANSYRSFDDAEGDDMGGERSKLLAQRSGRKNATPGRSTQSVRFDEDPIMHRSSTPNTSVSSDPPTNGDSGRVSHSHHGQIRHTSSIRDLLTCVALSFHAVFEGLAVGLADDTPTMWALCIGVGLHKYILAFCTGLELFTADKPHSFKYNFTLIFMFAAMSPIGIALGIAVTTILNTGSVAYNLTTGILQALAAGTLLYVVVFEVLQREKRKEKVPGMVQLMFVLLGFFTIYAFVIFGPEV